MQRMFAGLLFFVAAGCACYAQVDFHFHFAPQPGPYAVGLKVAEQYDRARIFHHESGAATSKAEQPSADGPRPLQILVWYPAVKAAGRAMTIGDYAALVKTETSFGQPMEHGKAQHFVDAFTHGTETLSTWAVRDAPTQTGRFPMVIYAPSVSAPATENIELCEYLASFGFMFLASPSMGVAARTMTLDVSGANAEAQDISYELDYAQSLPGSDVSAVAVVGYSWGAMSALFAAAHDKRITALISLDGSFRYAPLTVQQAGDVHPDQMERPLLVFSRAEEPLESWEASHPFNTAPGVLNQWTHGDLFHVHMLAMSHIQFSSLYQRSERFRTEALQFSPADYSLDEGAASYGWVARYSVAFCEAYLKHDRGALLFLKRTPAENGVPAHLMSVTIRLVGGRQ